MRNRTRIVSAVLLLLVILFSGSGCSKYFGGPSNEEAIKAITDSGFFGDGVEKFTLKAPIVVLDKGFRNSDGLWPVKVRMTFTYKISADHESKQMVTEPTFKLRKSTDNSGNATWNIAQGSIQGS